MNKTEFVVAVAEAASASKKDAENIINANPRTDRKSACCRRQGIVCRFRHF